MRNPPLLLLGYNRHELLEKRVKEISEMEIEKVYISIDGGRESHKPEMNDLILKIPVLLSKHANVIITHHKNNLGLTKHITSTISKILEENENIIVVEDDVAINPGFYKNITNGMNLLKSIGANGLVSAFSPINYSGNFLLQNKWRKSIYFLCWGWGCSRDTWAKYESDLSNINLDNALRNSHSWNSLSLWERNVWKSRFRRVQQDEGYTWDLQMQFASFLNDFTNLVPFYRFVDNEGFDDERATHTKNSKPKWMNKKSKNDQYVDHLAGNLTSKLFNSIDQLTIVGDSKLLPVYKNIRNQINFGKADMNLSIFLPKIKIHTWGGLGSQLYAVALAIDIQQRSKHRHIEYISHTSGVTKRMPAIQFYSRNVREKNDYKVIKSGQKNNKYKKKIIILGKKFLLSTGILVNCNDTQGLAKIKPWTLSIRGYYSHREVSLISAISILKRINNEFLSGENSNNLEAVALHYRLGDLELLLEKSSINTNQVKSILEKVLNTAGAKEIYLYSDSILLAKSKLINSKPELNIVTRDISPLMTIHECVHSKVFIGTNSKISIWIAILRATKNINQTSYLPLEIKHMLIRDDNSFVNKSINFY